MVQPIQTKQVIVIRKDLKMRRGKEIAQGAHASMVFLVKRLEGTAGVYRVRLSAEEQHWIENSFTKICLQVSSIEDLLDLRQQAKEAGLEANLITDSGTTEFDGVPTVTALAIGPDNAARIDQITGKLPLY